MPKAVPPPPPPLPSLTEPRGPLVPAWDFARRNRHVTVPLAVPAGFLASGAALAAAPSAAIPTAVGSAVLGASVWWAAAHKWDRTVEQWYARLSVLAGGGWLSVTAAMGLGLPELAAAAPLALAWGIPWYRHKHPRRNAGSITGQWNAWWQFYAHGWGLHGSHVAEVTTTGIVDTLLVQLHAGKQTDKDVTAILPLLESALRGHVRARMTRCERVISDPSQVLIHLKRENPLSGEVLWDDARSPATVTSLMPIGRSESGEWVMVPMLGNWFIIGRTRSGKSNELSCFLASLTGCVDAALPWIIDLKGGRSARPWQEAAGWTATTIGEARLVLGAAVAEIRARALHAYDGNEQLVPTPEVPAIFVVVDEAHGVLSEMSGDAECQRMAGIVAGEGSAVAVHLIVITQYGGLHESVGSEQVRGNLPGRLCFAVAEPDHGQFALTDYMKLDASRLENKGEFYYRLGPDQPSAPARGPHMPHSLVREIAARNSGISRPALVLYCGNAVAYTAGTGEQAQDVTWQQVYDFRHDRLPAALRHPSPAAVPPQAPASSQQQEMPDWAAEALARIEDEVASIPDLDTLPEADPQAALSAIERKKRLWARLLQDAPPEGIAPKVLIAGSGMQNSWTHMKLSALVSAGVVTKPTGGRYLPVPGQDVWQGLLRADEALNRLASEAEEMAAA